MCVGAHVPVYVRVLSEAGEGLLDPLELELQVIVSHLTWDLGTNSGLLQKQKVL